MPWIVRDPLSTLTGDSTWLEWIDAGARSILAAGVPGPSRDTALWAGPFGLDQRFGTAGAASFLLDWGTITENNVFLRGFAFLCSVRKRSRKM